MRQFKVVVLGGKSVTMCVTLDSPFYLFCPAGGVGKSALTGNFTRWCVQICPHYMPITSPVYSRCVFGELRPHNWRWPRFPLSRVSRLSNPIFQEAYRRTITLDGETSSVRCFHFFLQPAQIPYILSSFRVSVSLCFCCSASLTIFIFLSSLKFWTLLVPSSSQVSMKSTSKYVALVSTAFYRTAHLLLTDFRLEKALSWCSG